MDESSVRAAMATAGDLYAVVNLVGGWSGGHVVETSLDDWRRMLDLNATAAFIVLREAARVLQRPGRIVAVSSIASLQIAGGAAAYSVAKAALNALVSVLAAELRGSGITANVVAPSGMATPAMLEGGADAATLVDPAEVAEAIAFLLSDAASGISGTVLPIVR